MARVIFNARPPFIASAKQPRCTYPEALGTVVGVATPDAELAVVVAVALMWEASLASGMEAGSGIFELMAAEPEMAEGPEVGDEGGEDMGLELLGGVVLEGVGGPGAVFWAEELEAGDPFEEEGALVVLCAGVLEADEDLLEDAGVEVLLGPTPKPQSGVTTFTPSNEQNCSSTPSKTMT